MIYRVLFTTEVQPECAPEARECRRLLMAHLDAAAWNAEAVSAS